jgi:hypothetical protein
MYFKDSGSADTMSPLLSSEYYSLWETWKLENKMRIQEIESFFSSNGFDGTLEVDENFKMRGLYSGIISYSLVVIDNK